MHQAQTYALTMAPYAANKEEKKKKKINLKEYLSCSWVEDRWLIICQMKSLLD